MIGHDAILSAHHVGHGRGSAALAGLAPLIAYPRHPGLPEPEFFTHNKDLTAFLR